MHIRFREYWKKTVVLFFIGLVIFLFLRRNLVLADSTFISDMFFIIAMVYIISALWELVSNLGLFNSMAFGAKCFYRLFMKRLGPSEQVKDEYIEYVNSREKFGDVPLLFLVGIGLLGISFIPVILGNNIFS